MKSSSSVPKTEFNTSVGTSVEKLSSPEDGCSSMSDPWGTTVKENSLSDQKLMVILSHLKADKNLKHRVNYSSI